MAQYDGAIRINTDITTREAKKELKSLESSISDTAKGIASLRSKMDALKDVKISTQEFKDLEKLMGATAQKLGALSERQERFLATGGSKDSNTYKRMAYDAENLSESLNNIIAEMESLKASGQAFTLGSNTEEYAQMSDQIEKLNQKMQSDTERQAELQARIAEREEYLAQIRENAVVGSQRIIETAERIKQLEQEIADLKSAGITEGYSDYDNRVRELLSLKQENKELQQQYWSNKGKL